jgi:hypothetical protein
MIEKKKNKILKKWKRVNRTKESKMEWIEKKLLSI